MNESEIRRHLCEMLGVSPQASVEEIKKAYTVEAKKWHPDRVQHNPELAAMAESKLKEINLAYECLTDRVQFDKYAAKLARKRSESGAGSTSDGKATSSAGAASDGKASSSAGSTSNGKATSSAGTASSAGAAAGSNSSSTGASGATASSGADIVKIFVATGIFVIIVVLVANLTSPRRELPSNPGITLSPSESPGAPFSGPGTFSPSPSALPPDSSVSAPPPSN